MSAVKDALAIDIPDRLNRRARQDLILAEIRETSAIRISELALRMGVAGETIRRDLLEMDEAGLVHRTYGGATLPPFVAEPALSERGRQMVEERASIGRLAADLIEDGQTILIDIGSTSEHVIRAAGQIRRDLTIVTNSLSIATLAGANSSFRVMLCPGRFDPREGGVHGEETGAFFERYNAHWAIFGATGLLPDGPCEAHPGTAQVKRAMLRRASATMLVIDHSKFGIAASERICDLAKISAIVSDRAAPPVFAALFAKSGLRFHASSQ